MKLINGRDEKLVRLTFLKTIQNEIYEILNYMKNQERVKHGLFENKIGTFSEKEKNLIDKEIFAF